MVTFSKVLKSTTIKIWLFEKKMSRISQKGRSCFWGAILTSFFLAGCASSGGRSLSHPGAFRWPVRKATLTQPFRMGRKTHNGIDLAGKTNTPIMAIASGRVIYVGQTFRGFGKMVLIEHDTGPWASIYAHLNHYKVREGQSVSAGDTIGLMGKTGNASGTHLHFELRFKKRPVDPLKILDKGPLG